MDKNTKSEKQNSSEKSNQAKLIFNYWNNSFRMGTRELIEEILGKKPTEDDIKAPDDKNIYNITEKWAYLNI